MGDAELVARAAGGDRDAFGALYDAHAPAVHDFLRRMLGDPHDAADALQDTFLAAGSRLHQLRDPTKVRAWLYAIARRQAYRATSARRRFEPLEDDDVTAVDPDPTDAIADGELRALVAAAADGLDDRDRAVLELHFRHGLSGDELAAALGVERGNAHVLVHRVKERLQRSIGALAVARHGRAACPELAGLLGGWDGRLSTIVRKRVSRHAERCEICGATVERSMRPAALLGVVPLVPLPAGARELVLDRVELCSHTGEPWPGEDGFPPGDERPVPGDDSARRRASRALVGALVALLVFLVAGSVVLADADPVDRGQAPAGASEEESTTERQRRTTTSSTVAGTTSSTAATALEPSSPTTRRPTPPTTRRPGSTVPPTAPTTVPPTAPPPTPTTAPPTTTTEPPPTTSTTRPPPPTTTTRPRPTTTTTQPPVIG